MERSEYMCIYICADQIRRLHDTPALSHLQIYIADDIVHVSPLKLISEKIKQACILVHNTYYTTLTVTTINICWYNSV